MIGVKDMKYILDGKKMVSREETHQYLKETLGFPDYYGKNRDAFWDCLSVDCEYNFITVTGESKVADILKPSVEKMNEILEENKVYWHGLFDYEIID